MFRNQLSGLQVMKVVAVLKTVLLQTRSGRGGLVVELWSDNRFISPSAVPIPLGTHDLYGTIQWTRDDSFDIPNCVFQYGQKVPYIIFFEITPSSICYISP